MQIALLHTAALHETTFDRIFTDLDPSVTLHHVTRPDLLDRARIHGVDAVRAETRALLDDLSHADAVLCTCSTLGPLADEAAQSAPHILRIDRPLMERACATGPRPLVAFCLDSTRAATFDLLADCARAANAACTPIPVLCDDAWAHFETGDLAAYAQAITRAITTTAETGTRPDCIVLAQASMGVATPLLGPLGLPVYTSPPLAAARCLSIAGGTARGAITAH